MNIQVPVGRSKRVTTCSPSQERMSSSSTPVRYKPLREPTFAIEGR
jgi:hypothetical protein